MYTYIHTGGWGLVNIPSKSDNETQWNINGTQFLDEKIFNSPSFFSLSVGVDDKNSSVNVLTVSQCRCFHTTSTEALNQNNMCTSCSMRFLHSA